MDGIKHSGRFAEMERLVNDYFNCHIAPIMSKTRTDLIRNQGEEMKEYSTSLGGILSMMASSAQPMSCLLYTSPLLHRHGTTCQ